MGQKWRAAVPLSVGAADGPNLTQCDLLGRGLPSYHVASGSIQPFGHNTPTLQTDRQRSYSIGRIVLEIVAQKLLCQ